MKKVIKMRVGQYSQSMGRETVCFPPLPLPTGAAGVSQKLFLQTNQTYLDLGAKDGWGFEFVIRIYTGIFVLFFMLFLVFPLLLAFKPSKVGLSYWLRVADAFKELLPAMSITLSAIALFLLSFFLYILFSFLKIHPLRFNRERREVCLVKRGKAEFFPWEGIHVQISRLSNVTLYNVTHTAEMCIALLHSNNQGYVEQHIYGDFNTAINEWESVRQFMEFENMPTSNIGENTPYGQLIKYPPGTPQHFDRVRAGVKEGPWERYLLWLIGHLFTFWKLPCYLAGLINQLQRVDHSKEVAEWSKPIPKSQWEKPRVALIEESIKIKQAYVEGKDFMQYFDIPFK